MNACRVRGQGLEKDCGTKLVLLHLFSLCLYSLLFPNLLLPNRLHSNTNNLTKLLFAMNVSASNIHPNGDNASSRFMLNPLKGSGILSTIFNGDHSAPDGLTAREAAPLSEGPPRENVLQSLFQQIKKGTLTSDITALISLAAQGAQPIDDRKLLLEKIVVMLQSLGTESPLAYTMTSVLIKVLWQDLQHPPATFLNQKFRSADGSGNNPANPTLGKSGTPYARTVQPLHPMPHNLPDPSVVFDALLKRDTFEPHPSGISSLLFAFATVIIHSIFETNRGDPTINDATSYLDLSPLYGNTQDQQNTVRAFSQGLLYPDVIASSRLFMMPPAVVTLLILFNRNHNFIANRLFQINERGKFNPLEQLDDAGKKAQDEELFQTARLINCGYFLNVVFKDYIRVILNVNRTDSTWALIPTGNIHTLITGTVPEAGGNAVSVEFNLLYRWHAAISDEDDKWVTALFRRFTDKPFEELTPEDLGRIIAAMDQGPDPQKWQIPGWTRQPNGYFRDADLASILTKATQSVAGAFGARKSPACMRVIDVLGIAVARNEWNTCSLNEFRKFLNLKTFSTFEEWNPDPEIARVARELYVHPDNLELYVGMHAEAAKPSQAGSGLAPGYTISRAILSDAVALTRGDRHYTTDYNVAALTAWGFEDATPDVDGGSFGGCVGKLFMRTLPTAYTYNSIFALFPFSTPETTKKILTDLKIVHKYDFGIPQVTAPWQPVISYQGCVDVLSDHKRFGVTYEHNIETLLQENFFLGIDDIKKHARDREVMKNALLYPGWDLKLANFYKNTTSRLITEHSWSYDGKTGMLDVVRDVGNMAPVFWAADTFGVPLKTSETPLGLLSPMEFYGILSTCFAYIFLNFDTSVGFKLRENAIKGAKVLQYVVGARFHQISGIGGLIDGITRLVFGSSNSDLLVMSKDAHAFYSRVLKSAHPHPELKASCCSILTASTSNVGHLTAHVINLYLAPEQKKHYNVIVRLVKENTAQSDAKLMGYIYEAMRLDPQAVGLIRRVNFDINFKDGEKDMKLKKNDFVFASLKRSNYDTKVFKNPTEVDPNRTQDLYKVFGAGIHTCLGDKVTDVALLQIFKEVFKLKNVRYAPGTTGLFRFTNEFNETPIPMYISGASSLSPFPVSLPIVYDL